MSVEDEREKEKTITGKTMKTIKTIVIYERRGQ